MRRISIFLTVVGALVLPLAGTAGASDDGSVVCNGPLSGTVNANVSVPAGDACQVAPSTTINGNVHVVGSLSIAIDNNNLTPSVINGNLEDLGTLGGGVYTVNGDLTASGPGASFQSAHVTVTGSVTSSAGSFHMDFSTLGHNGSFSGPVSLIVDTIGGDLNLANSANLIGDTVDGNLNCSSPPTVVGFLIVSGHTNPQCTS